MKKHLISLFVIVSLSVSATAQNYLESFKQGKFIKRTDVINPFDSWTSLSTDDEMSRLDNFAAELRKSKDTFSMITGSYNLRKLLGRFMRKLYGYENYLVNRRGINPKPLFVNFYNDERNETEIKLWILPLGIIPTNPKNDVETPDKTQKSYGNLPFKFDELPLGIGCQPEFTVDLYELADALKIYAVALRGSPQSKALIVISPGKRRSLREARRFAADARNTLLNGNQIAADRITVKIGNRRDRCTNAELWLVKDAALK